MSRLNDMEEMIELICDEHLKEFMREAYLSYMAGAYRSTIIVSTIAVYEDLRTKTEQLSLINSEAKKITSEVKKRMNRHETFESYIEDQLVSKKILSSIDKRNLISLRDRRNLAAHPTDHVVSAEEARYIYSISIKDFLSKPLLYANEKVDFIFNSLKNQNYFPSNIITDIDVIVNNAIDKLHKGVFPFLVKELVKNITEITTKKNERFFLFGLCSISKNNSDLEEVLLKYFINAKAADLKLEKEFMSALAINSNLYILSDSITKSRIKTFINNLIGSSDDDELTKNIHHPVNFFELIIENQENEYLVAEFEMQISNLVELHPYNTRIIKLACLNLIHKEKLIEIYKENGGSSTYTTANIFANRIIDIDEIVANNIEPENCYEILVKMIQSAKWGSNGLRDMKNRMFNDIPYIKKKIKEYLIDNSDFAFNSLAETNITSKSMDDFIKKYLN